MKEAQTIKTTKATLTQKLTAPQQAVRVLEDLKRVMAELNITKLTPESYRTIMEHVVIDEPQVIATAFWHLMAVSSKTPNPTIVQMTKLVFYSHFSDQAN